VLELLLNLNKTEGTTLVLVTHDPVLAGRCRRQVRMRSGRIEAPAVAMAAAQ
jgi:putative ABC transport system ATP-binding protein